MCQPKILIVEDEICVARDIGQLLSVIGYDIVAMAASGKEAVERAEAERPGLVLMDIILNDGRTGIEAARQIRTRFDIPVVFLTALSDKETVKLARGSVPYGYLRKPIDENDLRIVLELALHKHRLEKEFKERSAHTLKATEDRYRLVVENISEGIVMLDEKAKITYANDKFAEMIGRPQDEILGRTIPKFLNPGLPRPIPRSADDAERSVWKPSELSWKRWDGREVITSLSPRPIFDDEGRFKGIVAVMTDITERRRVEEDLGRSRERQRRLSQYIQNVREKESKRIAREIHDELGQKLTAFRMDLTWIRGRLNKKEGDVRGLLDKTEAMDQLVDDTIRTVQKISAELRPGLLDDLGLVPAIEWLAQDFKERTRIQCRLRLEADGLDISQDCSTAVFRIAQEALTNVIRHAEASRVDISLKQKAGKLRLRVKDNGRGIRDEEVSAASSLGLMGMRERVVPFEGELKIKGAPNQGTTLNLLIPLHDVGAE